jgi:hypothetical protein
MKKGSLVVEGDENIPLLALRARPRRRWLLCSLSQRPVFIGGWAWRWSWLGCMLRTARRRGMAGTGAACGPEAMRGRGKQGKAGQRGSGAEQTGKRSAKRWLRSGTHWMRGAEFREGLFWARRIEWTRSMTAITVVANSPFRILLAAAARAGPMAGASAFHRSGAGP